MKVVVCRKKKDKKEGAKGLAKAGSAVSLQVRNKIDKKICPKVENIEFTTLNGEKERREIRKPFLRVVW